jgi:hypothetical protein
MPYFRCFIKHKESIIKNNSIKKSKVNKAEFSLFFKTNKEIILKQNIARNDQLEPSNHLYSTDSPLQIESEQTTDFKNLTWPQFDISDCAPPLEIDECDEYDDQLWLEIKPDLRCLIDKDTSIELTSALLLLLFYQCKFTQTSFRIVTDFLTIFTTIQIPKSIDSCIYNLLNSTKELIKYDKQFYCKQCKTNRALDYAKQRACQLCRQR